MTLLHCFACFLFYINRVSSLNVYANLNLLSQASFSDVPSWVFSCTLCTGCKYMVADTDLGAWRDASKYHRSSAQPRSVCDLKEPYLTRSIPCKTNENPNIWIINLAIFRTWSKTKCREIPIINYPSPKKEPQIVDVNILPIIILPFPPSPSKYVGLNSYCRT